MITIGSDEAGYGAWAGPLYVCAYASETGWMVDGLDDSKRLTPLARRRVYGDLDLQRASLVRVEAQEIDRFGVGHCLLAAHAHAIDLLLERYPDARIVVDGLLQVPILRAESIPHADQTVPSVMAASVIAKCNRDLIMQQLHVQHPQYGFASHVGYGTAAHRVALRIYGPCAAHRRSYRPIKELLDGTAH